KNPRPHRRGFLFFANSCCLFSMFTPMLKDMRVIAFWLCILSPTMVWANGGVMLDFIPKGLMNAAKAGDAEAQYAVGHIYATNKQKVPYEYDKAVEWTLKA